MTGAVTADGALLVVKEEAGEAATTELPKGVCRIKPVCIVDRESSVKRPLTTFSQQYLKKERDAAAAALGTKRSHSELEAVLAEEAPAQSVEDEQVVKRLKTDMQQNQAEGAIAQLKDEEHIEARLKTEPEDGQGGRAGSDDEDVIVKDEPGLKKKRGQNKKKDRAITHSEDAISLCNDIGLGKGCSKGTKCRYSHDIAKYLEVKGPDLGSVCPLFAKYGRCKFGLKCRFARAHTDEQGNQLVNQELMNSAEEESRGVTRDFQKSVRKLDLSLPRSTKFLAWVAEHRTEKGGFHQQLTPKKKPEVAAPAEGLASDELPPVNGESTAVKSEPTAVEGTGGDTLMAVKPEPAAASEEKKVHEQKVENAADRYSIYCFPEKNDHKKKIDFRGKSYLAPLTTVGNLPFRRICKGFGVDITCGEMAMANNLLSGQNTEWALCRRHKSEDIFGVQIAGSQAATVVKCAEAIEQGASIDFIDLNVGCPVDGITRYGCGSALLEKKAKLFDILQGCNYALDVPITCKLRMGVEAHKPITHKMIDMLKLSGVQAITLHGRSKAQRYTKLADWEYIDRCAKLAGDDLAFFGNGDVLSWEDYYGRLEGTHVSGIMIGRGALIKPWIFEEIKERKVKDISSGQRLDMLKDFAMFGLEHWGSDTLGVNTTRRFMCEWLSFLYRYVPVGLLEVLPQKMNERPPPFYGRDELETLMGSANSADWVKITELILGKAPEDFKFIPKSNAYEADDFSAEG
ncbi:tRNA-dihydrouridine(47) synthase [NAD(P)(+)]-like protein [Rhizophlyctis rosea]|nr:tRNA-dihydrouridine(47) synthase [NAD(P)(+)]-like protein [Rhizophlyctis rosea]